MINVSYIAHGQTYNVQVDLDCNAPLIFVGDQDISDLINSTDFLAIIAKAEQLQRDDDEDERGEYLHTMGYKKP